MNIPNWRVPLADPDGRSMLVEDVFADPRAVRSPRRSWLR